MTAVCTTRLIVIDLLTQHPEGMTLEELYTEMQMKRDRVWTCIRYARKAGSEIFYIDRYARMRGRGGMPQPVYKLGPGKDAARPVPNEQRAKALKKAVNKRWYESKKALLVAQARIKRGTAQPASPWAGLI